MIVTLGRWVGSDIWEQEDLSIGQQEMVFDNGFLC